MSGPAFVARLMLVMLYSLADSDMVGGYDFARYRKACREEVVARRIE